jgi:hypothetical protein
MRKSAPKLRLGPLPATGTVKMTFTCPIGLKADLERYAHYLNCQGVSDLSQLLSFCGGNRI